MEYVVLSVAVFSAGVFALGLACGGLAVTLHVIERLPAVARRHHPLP